MLETAAAAVDKQRPYMLISDAVNKPLIFFCVALTFPWALPLRAYPADKPTCAVLTFDTQEGVTRGEARTLTDRFSAELDRIGQYTRISREKQKEMLEEEVFARSENCSVTECALEVGRQLAAQYMIYGSLGKVGQTYTVYAVLVDVEKRKVERSATCDQRGEIDGLLTTGVGTLARKLAGGAAGRAEAGTGALPVGGAGLDDLVAEVRAKEDEQKRLEAERIEAQQRLAAEMLRRKAEFEKDYAAYRMVIGSKGADETMKRMAWERLTTAWGVKDAGAEPRGLRWDEATGLLVPTGLGASQGEALAVDLGAGVKMEFVWVSALKGWVGKYEVTNEEYRRFKRDHSSGDFSGHSLNGDRQPVALVNFDDAKAYAEWINKTAQLPEGYRCRLPDGNEWMTFAQCGDGRKYPWGNEWPPKYGNYHGQEGAGNWSRIDNYNDGYPVTCPVEQSGKNDWGLHGVGGNVWEWTSESSGGARVVRGASWYGHNPDYLECANRDNYVPSDRYDDIGFRLLLSR